MCPQLHERPCCAIVAVLQQLPPMLEAMVVFANKLVVVKLIIRLMSPHQVVAVFEGVRAWVALRPGGATVLVARDWS